MSAHAQCVGTEQGQVTLGYLESKTGHCHRDQGHYQRSRSDITGFGCHLIAWYMVMSLMTHMQKDTTWCIRSPGNGLEF